MTIEIYDSKRNYIVPGDKDKAIDYAVNEWVSIAKNAINDHDYFAVALSGGSTPKAIYKKLADTKKNALDWSKVLLFWSDERAVPPNHSDSNYKMAMESGFSRLPIPKDHIFRLKGEGDVELNAKEYEKLILTKIPSKKFDLMMLGMGDDGHTASLFPKTHGLHAENRLVIANFIPEKDIWRLTVTFECINQSDKIHVYVLGEDKAYMAKTVFSGPYKPDEYPVQAVGTERNPALFILDTDAAKKTFNSI